VPDWEVAAMSGRVVHFEIPVDDPDRAQEFYRSAFGWTMNTMPDGGYTLVSTTPTDEKGSPSEPGAINGGLMRRTESVPTPVITIDVDDVDKALEMVGTLGGSTVLPKQSVMGMGFSAYFKDSEGNLVGLWQAID
jgi:predicted enzyme related to lactoylglutathione lyase